MTREVLERCLDALLYSNDDDATKALDTLSASGWDIIDPDTGATEHIENGKQAAYLLHNPSRMTTLGKAEPVKVTKRPR